MFKKRSFFERLAGGIRMSDADDEETDKEEGALKNSNGKHGSMAVKKDVPTRDNNWMAEEEEEGQLTVDVYQTPSEIIIQTMVAGVRPENVQVDVTRDMVTIKGKRMENRTISDENYFTRELYWGAFSRTILLPQEVELEEAEAYNQDGLLTIKLPKKDKEKRATIKIKSL